MLSKRIWQVFLGVFAALGGLGGLACIFQWLDIKPKDLRMTPTVPHVLWLLAGLVLFALSFWSSLSSGWLLRRKIEVLEGKLKRKQDDSWESAKLNLEYRDKLTKLAEENGNLKAEHDAHADQVKRLDTQHNAELWNAREAYRQCMEEKRALSASLEGLSQLQLDALRLSSDLLGFLIRTGEPPAPKYSRAEIDRMSLAESRRLIESADGDYEESVHYHYGDENMRPLSSQALANSITAHIGRLLPFWDKVKAGYELDFAEQVKRISHRFTIEGLSDPRLSLGVDGRSGTANIKAIAAALWEMAYRISEKSVPIEKE